MAALAGWRAVQDRLASARNAYIRDNNGRLWGRPGIGIESKYLITSLGGCGVCDHNITSLGGRIGSPGHRKTLLYYGCGYHQYRGSTVCTNDFHAPMDEANALVLGKAAVPDARGDRLRPG